MSGEILIGCKGVTVVHGTRTLFEDVSLTVHEGDRLGLVGPNGAGKTTLLRLLAGLEPAQGGSVSRRRGVRLGFVEQSPDLAPESTAHDVVVSGMHDEDVPDYEKETRAEIVLARAGFTDPEQKVGAMSGGWRKRVSIARELAREPDLLLLDEPTNHLDLEGILWLEDTLASEAKGCVVVSHDRWFLQRVATRIVELSRSWPTGVFASDGTFADFLERREAALLAQGRLEESLANTARREIEWLRRGPKARTTKSQARIASAGRLQEELAEVRSRNVTRTAALELTSSDRRTKRLIVAEKASKSYGSRAVVRDLDLMLGPGTRIGLLGPNGSGKTTILRLLAGEIPPDSGTVSRAPALQVVRFEQGRDTLDLNQSLARALAPEGDSVSFRGESLHVSGWARRFLFRPEQLQVPVSRLSGGEQARVVLARLMLRPADVLLLDEPTNDLDIPTLEALEETLATFPGALVLVTHDRYLLDRVTTSLLALQPDGSVVPYADLAQWQASRERDSRPASSRPQSRPAPPVSRPASGGKGGSGSAKKKLSGPEQREWAGMESAILSAEQVRDRRRRETEDPIVAHDAARLHVLHQALDEAQAEVDRLYARWTELATKVD